MFVTPKAILFDLGDTVLREVRYEPRAGISRLLELSTTVPLTDTEEIHRAADDLYRQFRTGRNLGVELPCSSFLRLLCDRFRICTSLSQAELEIEFWKSICCMQPEPGIERVLVWAQSNGITTGVVSNAMFSGEALRWELARHDLLKYFRFVMSSSDYGLQKPHTAIFLAAVGKLDLCPADVLFIGDSLDKDVVAAGSAGMTAAWYNPTNIICNTQPQPATIRSWDEFVECLACE